MCLPVWYVLMVFVRYGNRNFLPWSLSYPGLPPFGFLQTKQLISLVVFYFAKSKRRQLPPLACYWLRPWTRPVPVKCLLYGKISILNCSGFYFHCIGRQSLTVYWQNRAASHVAKWQWRRRTNFTTITRQSRNSLLLCRTLLHATRLRQSCGRLSDLRARPSENTPFSFANEFQRLHCQV